MSCAVTGAGRASQHFKISDFVQGNELLSIFWSDAKALTKAVMAPAGPGLPVHKR